MKLHFFGRGREEGNSRGCDRLILIFAGWSTSPGLYDSVSRPGWDVAVAWDYDDLSLPQEIWERYRSVVVYAWSLGVFAAERALAGHHVTAAFALNGTGTPVDDLTGIPEAIYEGTRRGLDRRNLTRFRRRMAGDSSLFAMLSARLDPEPDIPALQRHLEVIAKASRTPAAGAPMAWHRVFISDNDRIFPPEAQRRYWAERPGDHTVTVLEGGHYIPIEQIVRATLPDVAAVGRRFGRALPTYDGYATPQARIAATLAGMAGGLPRPGDLLELGSGSGLFTHAYGGVLRPRRATFVDLYPIPEPYGIADSERYISADAELLMDTLPDSSYDIILSASTIQWFIDPGRFFANARRALRPGGVLLASTFVTGNLAELDTLRAAPLVYRTPAEIHDMLARTFGAQAIEDFREERLPVEFTDVRSALLHLSRTGVAGDTRTPGGLRALTRALAPESPGDPVRLTYRPLMFRVRR